MRCPSCNHDNRADRRFCAECGAPLAAACGACGASNEAGEKFCGGCGARLPPVTPAPGAAPPTPEPAGALPAGERRQLTVLFSDLVGSTEIAARLDAEEWRTLVVEYHRLARDVMTRFAGDVAKNLGDGPFVGRERELATLRDAWERAREGEGQVVLIVGEPGIGKSRLAQLRRLCGILSGATRHRAPARARQRRSCAGGEPAGGQSLGGGHGISGVHHAT